MAELVLAIVESGTVSLPDGETARTMLRQLLERHLVACGTVLEGVTSVYRWEGKVETSDEVLLIIKTRQEAYARLERELRARHPYELPEVLCVAIDNGLPAYLSWIDASLVEQ